MKHYLLFADYFQFYLQDEAADGNLSEAWTDEAVARLLAVAPGTVGIGTVRNMDVPVTVEVLPAEPQSNLAAWDHVVECSLIASSSKLVIAGCTDYFPDAERIPVEPGTYRVRVNYAGLRSLSENGLEGDDRYHLQLWPGTATEPVVVKQRAA
jgi:hypothetical protein